MARRSNYRRSEPDFAKAVVALLFAPFMAWMFFPKLRPFMVVGGVLLFLGGIGFLVYLHNRRGARAEAEWLRNLSGGAASGTPVEPVSAPPRRRYVTRKSLLSNAEIAFHKALNAAVPEAPIFPKVRVADVMDAAERYSGDFLRISQKHFDWVLCHPVSFEPLIAIELDDSSHRWSEKQRRNDRVKDEAASEAGIALLRFPWQPSYDVAQVRERIASVLDAIADEKEGAAAASASN